MKVTHLLLIASLACVSSASFGEDLRDSIQGRYDQISQLSVKKNKKALEKTIRRNSTSNFEFIDGMKNSLDLNATVRQNTEQLGSVYKFVSDSNQIIGVKQVGNRLVCTVRTTYDAFLSKNPSSRVKGVSISEDTWTKTLLGWKIMKSVVVKESTANKTGVLTASR